MTRKTLGVMLIAALAASTVLTAQQPVPIPTTNGGPTTAQRPTLPMGPNSTAVTDLGDIVVPAPLTEAQRAQIVIAAQHQEIWSLKVQNAQNELQKASAALQQLIASVTPPGYVLNGNLEFQKIEEPKKEPGTQ